VLEEMALPPVAGVTVPASLLGAPSKASPKARVDAMINLFILYISTPQIVTVLLSPGAIRGQRPK
jgi:hypothetical protein